MFQISTTMQPTKSITAASRSQRSGFRADTSKFSFPAGGAGQVFYITQLRFGMGMLRPVASCSRSPTRTGAACLRGEKNPPSGCAGAACLRSRVVTAKGRAPMFSLPVRFRTSEFGIFIRLDVRQCRPVGLMRW